MERNELVKACYNKACDHAPRSFFSSSYGYYRIEPKPITMDDGRVVNVEWVQPSAWTLDVLINYRTDCLKTTKLSDNEIKKIMEVI